MICVDCGNDFILVRKEQEFFLRKGYVLPKRCPACRKTRRMEKETKNKETEENRRAIESRLKWENEEKELETLLSKLSFAQIEFSNVKVSDSEKSLVIIGNGFDIMHGVQSSYYDFQKTIGKNNRLRWVIERYLKCENLWYNFEESLACLDAGSMLDSTDMWLSDFNAYDEDAQVADYYAAIDTAMYSIQILLNDLPRRFRGWVESLTCSGVKPLASFISKNALFLNFNYTDFLELLYHVPHDKIKYIHGCRRKEKGKSKEKLILGHIPDVDYLEGYTPSSQLLPRYKSKRKAYLLESAMDIGADRWLNDYEDEFTKKSSLIIKENKAFFDKMECVEDIYVIGHSLSAVDYPYFLEIARRNNGKAKWHIGYHGLDDMKRLMKFVNVLHIQKIEIFRS